MNEKAFDYYMVEVYAPTRGWEIIDQSYHLTDAVEEYKLAIKTQEEPVRLVGVNKEVLAGVSGKSFIEPA